MKSVFHRIADTVLWHGGPGKWSARNNIGILMLHGVHDDAMAARFMPPYNSLPLKEFKAAVNALLTRYNIISMDDAVGMLSGKSAWRSRCIVLTFDDSLKCLIPTAASWLSSKGLTATFYVSTQVVESRRPYWWKRLEYAVDYATRPVANVSLRGGRTYTITTALGSGSMSGLKDALRAMPGTDVEAAVQSIEEQLGRTLELSERVDPFSDIMSWDDVKCLASLGMTVGSHSVTHANLTTLPSDVLRNEMEQSRKTLEARLGVKCRHFSYPYGAYSDDVATAARAARYESAVTVEVPGFNRRGIDVYKLRRFAMPDAAYKLSPRLAGFDWRTSDA